MMQFFFSCIKMHWKKSASRVWGFVVVFNCVSRLFYTLKNIPSYAEIEQSPNSVLSEWLCSTPFTDSEHHWAFLSSILACKLYQHFCNCRHDGIKSLEENAVFIDDDDDDNDDDDCQFVECFKRL